MRVLLVIPPMTQLNTPYPSTACLKGALRNTGHTVTQADFALELVLRLFSAEGLDAIRDELLRVDSNSERSPSVGYFLSHFDRYRQCIDPVIRFLQGKDPTLAYRIVSRTLVPEGPRFRALTEGGDTDVLEWAFGGFGIQDGAKYLASLMVDDLADVVRDGIDRRFELSRYAEKLAASSPTFEPLAKALEGAPTLVDRMLDELVLERFRQEQPECVALTVPFAGNVYGAFRVARAIKQVAPATKLVLGGGYVNTELRELSESRVFDYFDFITLDDGEIPLAAILDHLEGKKGPDGLIRTYRREAGRVRLGRNEVTPDFNLREAGPPSYEGLPLDRYLSLLEMLNPMHRIWSDGRWNKLAIAHGCYWKKCSFCDLSLDYIGRYEPVPVTALVDRMAAVVKETGNTGFHFVDEAAPPAVLRGMAEELLQRKLAVTWWGNIRFDKVFTRSLTDLLSRSGCVAVTGGLEVASDRLLKLMQKGVTVEQVARVTRAFSESGILVHAYLMYGFPSQTEQETIDSLERVRQLFLAGCLHSAFWHRFSVTAHSPVGRNPAKYGIRLLPEPPTTFARNDLAFEDLKGCGAEVNDELGRGLQKAVYNYMRGAGLDMDVRFWFDRKVPKAKVPKGLIAGFLRAKAGSG